MPSFQRARLRMLGLSVTAAGYLSHWLVRGRKCETDRRVVLETWDAVADGTHNSNTDLIYWRDAYYLAHQTSPYHLGSSRSRMLLWRSKDAQQWEKVREFKATRGEYRDPTFGAIGERLFLYVLPNVERNPEPFTTAYSVSDDGTTWTEMVEAEPKGWLFWRPKTRDGEVWYVTAYWNEHGRSILLQTGDGVNWTEVSRIFEGERNDETDCEFLPDGRMIATSRLEAGDGWRGDPRASTLISVASPPYTDWARTKSFVTRLDGPCLFPYNGRVYALGRYQASFAPWAVRQGGLFGRKRTSLFLVEPERLVYLTDLPSAGDTSYGGIAIRGEEAFASYYTSAVEHDLPWVLGMLRPSDIKMARISLPALERLAQAKREIAER